MAHKIISTQNREIIRSKFLYLLGKSIPTWQFLPVEVVNLLVDGGIVLKLIGAKHGQIKDDLIELSNEETFDEEFTEKFSSLFYDYSFMIAPTYKAYEGYLGFIAKELQLPVEDFKHHIGGLYDWDRLEKDKKNILEKLKGKLGDDRDSKERWSLLNMILRQYRHNPAHFYGDLINSYEQAENYVKTIYSTINKTNRFFIDKKLIENKVRCVVEAINLITCP